MVKITNLEVLAQQSDYAKYVVDILDFYVPLVLQLPKLRDNPQLMKETVKARSASGVTDVATQADEYVQEKIKEEVLQRHLDWQFWGEEGSDNVSEYDSTKTILVVNDPIEGTNNFKHHKDNQWGSVIGLVDVNTRKPIAGIIAHPIERTFYVGVKDVGAFELKYDEKGVLVKFNRMKAEPEFDEFTYNNSPHFEDNLVAQVEKFYGLGEVQPLSRDADELERSRREVHINRNGDDYIFVDPESGALEAVRYRGTICFKTSNEMAAVFPIIEELGGKVTDGNGNSWSLGINTLIAGRNAKDYELLKEVYNQTRK
ncbi:MAG: inositol monophosphatase family protein [Candidatus Woesearchaeota archaeon]